MTSNANTPEEYINELPEDRKEVVLKIISTIELDSQPQSLYIHNDKLVMYGMDYRDLYEIQPVGDEVGVSLVPIRPSNKVFLT